MEVKKKCEKQMPIKQKEMTVIGEKYKKIIEEKAKKLQEDAGKFKGDVEQMKAAMVRRRRCRLNTHQVDCVCLCVVYRCVLLC